MSSSGGSSAATIPDPWADDRVATDPYPFYAALREHAPVWRVPGTRTFLVASWDLLVDAVGRTDDFSSNLTAVLIRGADGGPAEFDMTPLGEAIHVLAVADEPDHTPQRRLAAPHFTAKRLESLVAELEALTDSLWTGGVVEGRIEWMTAMGDQLPMTLVTRVLGLPDHDVPQLIVWAYEGTELLGGLRSLEEMGDLVGSAAAHEQYLVSQFRAACADPLDDLLGDLARAVEAGDMTEAQAVGSLVTLVGAGGESTAGLIGNAARILAERPDLQDRLRADPALVPRYLEEVLRLESPFRGHFRHVRTETTLGGVALVPGDHLLLLWAAANRDPDAFPEPDEIRLDRRVSANHVAFGRGIHFCLGAPLARLEARSAIEALVTRTRSFGLDPDDGPEWAPSLFVRRHHRLPLLVEAIPG